MRHEELVFCIFLKTHINMYVKITEVVPTRLERLRGALFEPILTFGQVVT